MKTPRHWLIAVVIGLGALSARGMEPQATMQIGVVGAEGDYHIKLHGAPPHAPVTLVVDGRPFTPVTFTADSFGRLDLPLSSVLSSMRDNLVSEEVTVQLRAVAVDSQNGTINSNPIQFTLLPSAILVSSLVQGAPDEAAIQWFDVATGQEIDRMVLAGRPERIVYTPNHETFFVLTDAASGTVLCLDGVTHERARPPLDLGPNIVDLMVTRDGRHLLALSRGRVDRFGRGSPGKLIIHDAATGAFLGEVTVDLEESGFARIIEDQETSWRVFVAQSHMQVAQINLMQRYREALFNIDSVTNRAIEEQVRDMVVAGDTVFVAAAARDSAGETHGSLAWLVKGTLDHGKLELPGMPLRVIRSDAREGRGLVYVLLEKDPAVLVIDAATREVVGSVAIPPGASEMALSARKAVGVLLFPGNPPAQEAYVRFFETGTLELLPDELPLGRVAPKGLRVLSNPGDRAVLLLPDQQLVRIIDLNSLSPVRTLGVVGRPTGVSER
jgi:hypothetical protein